MSHGGATIEQIADAAGHANSHITQVVYRHSLADTVTTAATIWPSLNGTHSGTETG